MTPFAAIMKVFDQLGRAVLLHRSKIHDRSVGNDGLRFGGIDIQGAALVTAGAQTMRQLILYL
jgi:hypothetical protein